jgi:hypothetical protein
VNNVQAFHQYCSERNIHFTSSHYSYSNTLLSKKPAKTSAYLNSTNRRGIAAEQANAPDRRHEGFQDSSDAWGGEWLAALGCPSMWQL